MAIGLCIFRFLFGEQSVLQFGTKAEDTSRSFTIKAELRALSPGRKVD
jgi:hypothetical protein